MNNDILELIQLAFKDSNPLTFKNLLTVCRDSKLFQRSNCKVENMINLVNSLLNVSSECENGISILKVLLPQCKSDVIGVHLLQWLQLCTKALHYKNHSAALYELLRDLIIYSKEYPDIRKQTSLTVIPKIMDYHFKGSRTMTSKIDIPFLLCLEEILLHYGKSCGHLRRKIEQFLLSKLESSSDVVYLSAKCYLNLLAVGPTCHDKQNSQELWYNKQSFFISALHNQLDHLYQSVNEIQGSYDEFIVDYDSNLIPEISDESPLNKAQRVTHVFKNLVQFLTTILLGAFPAEKLVNPEAIFSVICRGLSINCTTLEANVTCDTLILSTQVPTIQESCLGLLEALIKCCRQGLLSHAELISKLFTQTLKWTKVEKCDYGLEKPYSELRVKAYYCFRNWVTDARKGSCAELFIDDIVPSIIADVHYSKPSVTLSIATKRLKGKPFKKQRKRNQDNSNVQNTLPNVVNLEANKEVCVAALDFIPSLLEATFDLVSLRYHKRLQELIVNEILTMQVAHSLDLDLPIPYSDESCQSGLYRALLALCNYYHPEFTNPVNYAVSLFHVGVHDLSFMISRLCGQAVVNLEKLINPVSGTLKYPLKLTEEITTSRSNQQIEQINEKHNVLDQSVYDISISRLFEEETLKSYGNTEEADTSVTMEKSTIETAKESTMDMEKTTLVSNEVIAQDRPLNEEQIQFNNTADNCSRNDLDSEIETSLTVKNGISQDEQVKETAGEPLISSANLKINNESYKRLNDDADNGNHLEKKKKEDHNESSLSATVSNELESAMLSSFVDIVE